MPATKNYFPNMPYGICFTLFIITAIIAGFGVPNPYLRLAVFIVAAIEIITMLAICLRSLQLKGQ